MVLHFAYAESLELAGISGSGNLLVYQQGSAYCSHDFVMLGDDDFGVEFFLKCLNDSLVEGDPTLKHYGWLDIFSQADVIEVVAH